MAPSKLCLITVAAGDTYVEYARQLFESAQRHLKAADTVDCVMLPGVAGWPAATMRRYHVIGEHARQLRLKHSYTHIFLCDADMRFEADVGPEILPAAGLTATLHPGYVGADPSTLPFETNQMSHCYVPAAKRERYFAGGFVGGTARDFLKLANRIAWRIDGDAAREIVPVWHDESALNHCLVATPPAITLSPAYCHPDSDDWYLGWWPEPYERKLVALDKKPEEREGR